MSEYANEKLLALDQLKAAVREYDNHTPLKYIGGQDVPEEVVKVEGRWDQDTLEERREAFINFLCSIIETSGWPSDQFRADLEEAVASKTFIKFADYVSHFGEEDDTTLLLDGNSSYIIPSETIDSVYFGGSHPNSNYISIRTFEWGEGETYYGEPGPLDPEGYLTNEGYAYVVKPGTHTEPYWQSREGEDLKIWNDIIDKPAFDTYLKRVDLTQEEYDALPEKDPFVVYVVSDSPVPPVQEHIKVQFVWPDDTPIEGLTFELYDHEGGMLENFATALDTFEYICFTIKDPYESYTLTYIGSPEYNVTIYPTADGFGVEVSQVQPQPTDGKAYFVVSNDGLTGTFFRSNETYENESVGTFRDIYGNSCQGTVYNEIESPDGWQVPKVGRETITSIGIAENQIIAPRKCRNMFYYYEALESIDLSSFNTSSVSDMCDMFYNCRSLTSLDLSNFDTSNVSNMNGMFHSCSSLTSLNLSSFNTSNVIDMGGMFADCNSLTGLDITNFNTSNVTDMNSMFWSCSSLTSLDVTNFNTSNVTNMNGMFASCRSLPNLDVTSFNTSNVTDMIKMFYGCRSLTSLDLSNFDTSNITDINNMFDYCLALTSLDLSSFDTSNVTYMNSMFNECYGLTTIYANNWYDSSRTVDSAGMFYNCTSLPGYDEDRINWQKARIQPDGYFTLKEANNG